MIRDEPTSAMISFTSPRDPNDDTHARITLGSEAPAPGEAPYSFTIMIANAKVTLSGIQTSANVVERVPLSHQDIEALKAWLEQETSRA